MKIIQVTEGAKVVNATSTSIIIETVSIIKETVLSRKSLPEEVEEPRPWPHDGVVRSWAY